jgi:hypothetical protein
VSNFYVIAELESGESQAFYVKAKDFQAAEDLARSKSRDIDHIRVVQYLSECSEEAA